MDYDTYYDISFIWNYFGIKPVWHFLPDLRATAIKFLIPTDSTETELSPFMQIYFLILLISTDNINFTLLLGVELMNYVSNQTRSALKIIMYY